MYASVARTLVAILTSVLQFYFSMFLVYSALAIAWGWLCYQNVQDLLPIQVCDDLFR